MIYQGHFGGMRGLYLSETWKKVNFAGQNSLPHCPEPAYLLTLSSKFSEGLTYIIVYIFENCWESIGTSKGQKSDQKWGIFWHFGIEWSLIATFWCPSFSHGPTLIIQQFYKNFSERSNHLVSNMGPQNDKITLKNVDFFIFMIIKMSTTNSRNCQK